LIGDSNDGGIILVNDQIVWPSPGNIAGSIRVGRAAVKVCSGGGIGRSTAQLQLVNYGVVPRGTLPMDAFRKTTRRLRSHSTNG
jgi:hypothetical protein